MAGGTAPEPLSSLVGRERDIATVAGLVADHRLVTVTGPGGVGKTRLALAAATAAGAGLAGGTRWVDLSAVTGPEPPALPAAVADAVGVREAPHSSLAGALRQRLRGQPMLIVLDNAEHLVTAVADLVDALLTGCPDVRVLVTSREVLGLPGERRWPVPPLPVPDSATLPALPELADIPAIRLFIDRATAVDPSFALTERNAAAVAAVCAGLDGLPLAIELAAGRVAAMSVDRIASRLDDPARLVAGTRRGGATRQRTLRASMDWSHDLLPAAEQALFRRLAAFAGSFGLDEAEAVCADGTPADGIPADGIPADRTPADRTPADGSPLDRSSTEEVPAEEMPPEEVLAEEVLPLLSRLAEKSLVQLCRQDGHGRYRLLKTVRWYAEERLRESGEADRVRARHAELYAELAERADTGLAGHDQAEWRSRLEADQASLRAALLWSLRHRPAVALRLAAALHRWWVLSGHYAEGLDWLDRALATGAGPDGMVAKARTGAGMLALLQCRYDLAADRLQQALPLLRAGDDRAGTAAALQTLGGIAREQGRYADADRLCTESLALWRAAGDPGGEAACRNRLAFTAWLSGDPDRAAELAGATLATVRRLGDRRTTVACLINLGAAALGRVPWTGHAVGGADLEAAEQELTEGLALARRIGYAEGTAWCLDQLGRVALRRGAPERAAALLADSLTMHTELGDLWRTASVLDALAALAAGRGGTQRAARLSAAADGIRERIGTPLPPCERQLVDSTAALLRAAVDAGTAGRLRAAGAAADLADIVAEAMAERAPVPPATALLPVPTASAPATDRAPEPVLTEPAAVTEPGLRVYGLGAAREYRGDHLLGPADWTYQKPRELLHFLLSQQACTKEQIGLALWPEADGETLRNSFHTTLRHLRRALGRGDWVLFHAGRYRLNRSLDYVSDVERFESLLAAAREAADSPAAVPLLEDAVAGYRGEFVADLPAGGWAETRRADLRRQVEAALLTLGERLRAQGEPGPAAAAYRRLVALDGLLEVAHRQLMLCYADLGERGRALRQYGELVDLLSTELGVAPAPETTALYHRLRRAAVTAA